jgi:hypothetical protein
VEEEQGIYRGEVLAIMGALSDIYNDTTRSRLLLDEEDADGEEEEEDDA